jgi:CheY-like chemotaxis protein
VITTEALDRLRSDRRTHNIPVVMLSADATPAQIARLLGQGAHDYLTKPIGVQKFLQTGQLSGTRSK